MDPVESITEKLAKLYLVEQIKPSFSESMNPLHHGSTQSSPPTMKPSQRSRSLESMNPGHDGSTPSSPSTMDPSPLSSVDTVRSPPPIYTIKSIKDMYKNIDPVQQIDLLINFVENQLDKMNNPSEAEASSSEDLLEIIRDNINLAASVIDTIFIEAESLFKSDTVEGVGELHWVIIALSAAAFAVESYTSVWPIEKECRELLLEIVKMTNEIKQFREQMSAVRGKLWNALGSIVDLRGIFFRFWSATTAAAQLKKTNQQLGKDYRGKDLFLSHSGKQKNFVRRLHLDLTREHVSCFFDEDRNCLPLAEKFPPLIFKAAETCTIAVVVLSKEFIHSKWPMIELSAFIRAMNSGKNVNLKLLPIFFMITPKELSDMTKTCPEWKKFVESNDTRGDWRAALKEVRPINGLCFHEGDNEVAFRDEVRKAICGLLKRINPRPPQLLDFEPVGIEEQVREVKELLKMKCGPSALAVIVYGFGGMGKSTLVHSVVQSLDWSSTDFKFCRVVIDKKTTDIIKLQENMLYDLEGVKPNLGNPSEGHVQIKEALKKKCYLLLIDNVVDKDYIQYLLPNNLLSGEQKTKLRIIITSREKNVKAELDPNIICIEYEVKGLSGAASKSLLSKTIQQSQVVKDSDLDEEHMINEVAAACRGVPLLLSVFGKHLRVERNKDSYQEALDVLREGNLDSYRDEDLGTKVMFVYNKIKDVEVKEAFLDICTYFHGWQWNLVGDIVDFPILNELHRRTLVSKSGSGQVIVHDILRLMGLKESKLTRFSNYKELSDALEDNLDGFGNVKGISLVTDNPVTIQSTRLEAMRQSLRVLMLGDWVTLDGPPCHKAFTNLRYLHVGDITAFPFKDPSKLHKLRVFLNRSKPGMNLSHIPQSLKRISHEVPDVDCEKSANLPFQNLSSLKSFIVKPGKLLNLPEELHLPASLVDLHLNRCKNLPKDIGHLAALESLILDGSDLECLPRGFGKLKKLKHLSMDYCSKLAFLPEEFGMLSSLEVLSMEDCRNLRALPDSFGGLVSLQTLELRGSIKLQQLPESFGELRIHSLKLHSLVKLHKLPNSFGNMPFLKYLSLESCRSLMSLPKSFVQLKMLETLEIINCTKLSVLPEDFSQLTCLKHMTVKDCHLLEDLPHGFGALPALKTLKLQNCESFVNLPRDFTELTCLEELFLESLPSISRIPDGFSKLTKLRFLDVNCCLQLKTLADDFENMPSLERLTIQNCPELEGAMMDKILKLQNCYIAYIDGSRKLSEKWEHMQGETHPPIVVVSGAYLRDKEDRGRAIGVALLHGKCMEVNNATGGLMERSSLLVGLEESITATVALIMLPIQMQSHQHQILQRFVEMAREAAKTNGSGKLQIVCARKVALHAERPTATEKEEITEEEDIRQIRLALPEGLCVIHSSESRRVKILTWCCDRYNEHPDKLSFFMADLGLDTERRNIFENFKFTEEDEMRKPENKHYNSIQNCIKSICPDFNETY